MLDYDWGNPQEMMISGEEPESAMDSDHTTRQILDHYATSQTMFIDPENSLVSSQNSLFAHHFNLQQAAQSHIHPFYNHRTHLAASDFTPPSLPVLDPVVGTGAGFLLVPKNEDVSRPRPMEFASRIGLNLGGRTYFSSGEDDFINRLYRRNRPVESGLANSPRCQAEGCNADLSHSKHYHRRHKVCELHSKASTVIAGGLTQRFCQQCSRFHLLAEFDNGKRSCRERLADHNRRRRKTHRSYQGSLKSPSDSLPQSSSSVTLAVSPATMSLDNFLQRSYPATTSSASSSSIFFSNGGFPCRN